MWRPRPARSLCSRLPLTRGRAAEGGRGSLTRHFERGGRLIFTHRRNRSGGRGGRVEIGDVPSDEESSGPEAYFFEVNVNDRSKEQRHDLREKKAAYDGYSKSTSRFSACAKAQRDL